MCVEYVKLKSKIINQIHNLIKLTHQMESKSISNYLYFDSNFSFLFFLDSPAHT